MNRRMPIIDDCFISDKPSLLLPQNGNPCLLIPEFKVSHPKREDQYLKKIKDCMMIEEDQTFCRLLLIEQELTSYFESLRKLKI